MGKENAPRKDRKEEREREEEESVFEGCFQLLDKGPRFVKKGKSTTAEAKNEEGAKPATSFIGLGG